MSRLIVILCLSFIADYSISADSFDKGVDAFSKENYKEAVAYFKVAVEDSPNDLSGYYNLGLSYMGMEDFGNALWCFEKVLKKDPSDDIAAQKASLAYQSLNKSDEWQPIQGKLLAKVYSISSDTWSIIAIICSLICCLAIIFLRKSTLLSLKRISVLATFASAFVLLITTYFAYATYNFHKDNNYGIVTDPKIPTYLSGNTANGSIDHGTRLYQISNEPNSFIKVVDQEGNTYLIHPEDLKFL